MHIPFIGHKEEFKPPEQIVSDGSAPTFVDSTVSEQISQQAPVSEMPPMVGSETVETTAPASVTGEVAMNGADVGVEQVPSIEAPALEAPAPEEPTNLPPVA